MLQSSNSHFEIRHLDCCSDCIVRLYLILVILINTTKMLETTSRSAAFFLGTFHGCDAGDLVLELCQRQLPCTIIYGSLLTLT